MLTPLMKLCAYDGKLEDIKKILDENSEAIKVSLKAMSTIVFLSPNTKSLWRPKYYSIQDVASNGRNALSYYSEFGSSPQVLKLLVEAHPDGAKNEDAKSKRDQLS